MSMKDLRDKIKRRKAVLGVVGLGYVGLPVACKFAEAGFLVLGVDRKAERVEQINAGVNPIEGEEPGLAELLRKVAKSGRFCAAKDYGRISEADVVLISVETPVDENHTPRFEALRAATENVGRAIKPGALVIVESTVAPGTIEGVVRPILEETSG